MLIFQQKMFSVYLFCCWVGLEFKGLAVVEGDGADVAAVEGVGGEFG